MTTWNVEWMPTGSEGPMKWWDVQLSTSLIRITVVHDQVSVYSLPPSLTVEDFEKFTKRMMDVQTYLIATRSTGALLVGDDGSMRFLTESEASDLRKRDRPN